MYMIKKNSLGDFGLETERAVTPLQTKYLSYQTQLKPSKESAATN